MFELVLVGDRVSIIAAVIRSDPRWPRGSLALSAVKATVLVHLPRLRDQREVDVHRRAGGTPFIVGPGLVPLDGAHPGAPSRWGLA